MDKFLYGAITGLRIGGVWAILAGVIIQLLCNDLLFSYGMFGLLLTFYSLYGGMMYSSLEGGGDEYEN